MGTPHTRAINHWLAPIYSWQKPLALQEVPLDLTSNGSTNYRFADLGYKGFKNEYLAKTTSLGSIWPHIEKYLVDV